MKAYQRFLKEVKSIVRPRKFLHQLLKENYHQWSTRIKRVREEINFSRMLYLIKAQIFISAYTVADNY